MTVDYEIPYNKTTGKVNKKDMMKVAKELLFNHKKQGDWFIKDATNREFVFTLSKDGNNVEVSCEFAEGETESGRDRSNRLTFYYSPRTKKIEDVEYESYFVESVEGTSGRLSESVTRKFKEASEDLRSRMADFLLCYADYYDLHDAMEGDFENVEDWVHSIPIDELAEAIRFDIEDDDNGDLSPRVIGDDTIWFDNGERPLEEVREEAIALLREYDADYEYDHYSQDGWDKDEVEAVNVKRELPDENDFDYDFEF